MIKALKILKMIRNNAKKILSGLYCHKAYKIIVGSGGRHAVERRHVFSKGLQLQLRFEINKLGKQILFTHDPLNDKLVLQRASERPV